MSEKPAETTCAVIALTGSANLAKHEATKKQMEELLTNETLKTGVHMVGLRYQFATVTDVKQFEDEKARGKLKKQNWLACDFLVDKNTGSEYERAFKTGQPIVLTEKDNLLVYPIFFLRGQGANVPVKVILHSPTHPKAFISLAKNVKPDDKYAVMLLDSFAKQAHHTNGNDLTDTELKRHQDECVAYVTPAPTGAKRKEPGESEITPVEKKSRRSSRGASQQDIDLDLHLEEDVEKLSESASKLSAATQQLNKSEKSLEKHEAQLQDRISNLSDDICALQQTIKNSTTELVSELSALRGAFIALRSYSMGSSPLTSTATPMMPALPAQLLAAQANAPSRFVASDAGGAPQASVNIPIALLNTLLGSHPA
jgi:hypothetical protein